MKILLTGPKGNLGSEVIKQSSHDIIGLDREGWDNLPDILSSGIDVVIHTAYDLKNKLENSPYSIMHSNLLTTTILIEKMKQYKTPRLIFISSGAVYGESMRTDEESNCNPISVNGIVKLLNERVIEEYCSKNGIKFEIYRVFNMYGGNDHFSVLSKLRKAIENNSEFVLNNYGISQRDFIHLEDVAKIILQLIEMEHSYTHLNIGTGVSTRICDIVNQLKKRNPHLKIKYAFVPEAEYSRADITRLRSLVEHDFINVLDFVEQNF